MKTDAQIKKEAIWYDTCKIFRGPTTAHVDFFAECSDGKWIKKAIFTPEGLKYKNWKKC